MKTLKSLSLLCVLPGMLLPGNLSPFAAWKTPEKAFAPADRTARAETMEFLENSLVKVGIDLQQGGTITYLSEVHNPVNLINAHDRGRQIQQSYYAGPQPFGDAHPDWKDWPWNPIGTGDVYGNASKVLAHTNDGKTLYVKTIPMQWALNNVPGECAFETWISLRRNAVLVRNRLTNNRPDKTQYPARSQELPAVYTIGKLYRLFTYDGDKPFTDAPVREIKNAGPPWADWKATEHWAALVDDDDRGLGIFHNGVYSFIGGFHGKPNTGGPKDDSTGYLSPIRSEILDYNIVYEYDYTLFVGNLKQIRAFAVRNRPTSTLPDYHFRRDRQHWILNNASDAGWPFKGSWKVLLEKPDPQLIGPEQWWLAKDVPRLLLRAAFHTRQKEATLFWSVAGDKGFSENRSVNFPVIPDGKFRTYEIDLSNLPAYSGTITGLRLDPVADGAPGDYVEIAYLSWR